MSKISALACIGWITCGGAGSNVAPLSFGMTPDEAATALGLPLTRVAGRGPSAIYRTEGNAAQPGFYPLRERLYLQFRRGALTGWKYDWRVLQPSF